MESGSGTGPAAGRHRGSECPGSARQAGRRCSALGRHRRRPGAHQEPHVPCAGCEGLTTRPAGALMRAQGRPHGRSLAAVRRIEADWLALGEHWHQPSSARAGNARPRRGVGGGGGKGAPRSPARLLGRHRRAAPFPAIRATAEGVAARPPGRRRAALRAPLVRAIGRTLMRGKACRRRRRRAALRRSGPAGCERGGGRRTPAPPFIGQNGAAARWT